MTKNRLTNDYTDIINELLPDAAERIETLLLTYYDDDPLGQLDTIDEWTLGWAEAEGLICPEDEGEELYEICRENTDSEEVRAEGAEWVAQDLYGTLVRSLQDTRCDWVQRAYSTRLKEDELEDSIKAHLDATIAKILEESVDEACERYEKHLLDEERKKREEVESQGETYTPIWMAYTDWLEDDEDDEDDE